MPTDKTVTYSEHAVRNFIKENLKIKVVHSSGQRGMLEISLVLGDEVISSDYIDYSDVIRVATFTTVE